MDFYFPIADIVFNPWMILGLGIGIGFLSGLFGVGTGILITPVLLLLGFPGRIAVASQLSASIGANFSGFLSYGNRKDVDYALGFYLIFGGLLGAFTEFYILKALQNVSPYSVIRIVCSFVLIFLSLIMFYQTIKSLLSDPQKERSVTMKKWMIYIPFHRVFLRSRTEISILVPIVVGFITGILTMSLGGGVNIMMMPILTYLIGRISPCVTGTSFFVAFVICFSITLLHGVGTAPVDFYLVVFLSLSTSIGSKLGILASKHCAKSFIGLLGAVIVLFLGIRTLLDVLKQQTRRPKIVLNNGVTHYIKELVETMPEDISWLAKKTLLFAHQDIASYCAVCIIASILIAFIVEKILNFLLFKKEI
ncbi:MAG: sulfite exporter TauE/SafE family protein [Proteobacteria bacterium]|nr:sulfite exporter TauE/SafE family protein [Pseudomonadota bacterium]